MAAKRGGGSSLAGEDWSLEEETEKRKERRGEKKEIKNGGSHVLEGGMEGSKNGGWEREFEGVCKIEVCLEVLLELGFCTKPLNFRVEAPTGVALSLSVWTK
jgi:hypothetical protein